MAEQAKAKAGGFMDFCKEYCTLAALEQQQQQAAAALQDVVIQQAQQQAQQQEQAQLIELQEPVATSKIMQAVDVVSVKATAGGHAMTTAPALPSTASVSDLDEYYDIQAEAVSVTTSRSSEWSIRLCLIMLDIRHLQLVVW